MALTMIRTNGGELALNIKLRTHTHTYTHWVWGEGAVSDYRKCSSNESQLGATLIGIAVRFLLIQLSDKCSLGLYSSVVSSRPFDLSEGCMNRPGHVVFAFRMKFCIFTAVHLFS